MAADFYREKEHAFLTIEKDLKSGKIPRLVLLCGKEEYLIQWYTDTLIQRYVHEACKPLDLVTLEGDALRASAIIEGLETVGLMSERKIVYLPDFLPAAGKFLKGFSEAELKKLLEYLPRIPEGSMLLISAAEQEETKAKKNKVRSAIEKHGKVYDFQPLRDQQLRGFIEKRFRLAGKSCAPAIISMIMSESGYGNKAIDYTLYHLENDLKKIIACSDGMEVTAADVGAVLSTNPENNIFAMLDAISRNRKDEAFRLLHNLLNSGTPVFNLLRLITGQLELILSVKEMKEERESLTAMQKKLGVHQFRIKKAMTVTGQYSVANLKRMLAMAYEVDETIKTGLMEGSLALEYLLASL